MFRYLLACCRGSSEVPLVMFSRKFPCERSCGIHRAVCRLHVAFSVWKGKPVWIAHFFLPKPTFVSSLYCIDDYCVWLLLISCTLASFTAYKDLQFLIMLASEGSIFRGSWVYSLLSTVAVSRICIKSRQILIFEKSASFKLYTFSLIA